MILIIWLYTNNYIFILNSINLLPTIGYSFIVCGKPFSKFCDCYIESLWCPPQFLKAFIHRHYRCNLRHRFTVGDGLSKPRSWGVCRGAKQRDVLHNVGKWWAQNHSAWLNRVWYRNAARSLATLKRWIYSSRRQVFANTLTCQTLIRGLSWGDERKLRLVGACHPSATRPQRQTKGKIVTVGSSALVPFVRVQGVW